MVEQTQLLFFSALALIWLQLNGLYPSELKSTNLDSEWLYRKVWPSMYGKLAHGISQLRQRFMDSAKSVSFALSVPLKKQANMLLMPWPVREMLLAVILFMLYLNRPIWLIHGHP